MTTTSSHLRRLLWVAAGLALVVSARLAQAQTLRQPEARQGFYVSFGGGANALATWDKGHRDAVGWGPAYTLRLGEMLTERWGLGLAIDTGSAKRRGVSLGIGGLTLEAQAQLWRHLALRVGAGLGAAMADDPLRVDDETHGTYGSLLTAAVSYDAFLTSRPTGGWALTPVLGFRAVPGGDVTALSVVAALSLSWWSGLPARELRATSGP